jgi:hypothetical protein
MSDKDSKLIFEAYKNLLNENPVALTGVGLGVLEALFMSLGLVGLAKLINQLDINAFSQVAPTQASVLETLDDAVKDFEVAIESNDPDNIKLKTEQVLLLFNDIESPISPLLKSISSILLESIDSYYATGEDFYLAAASVSVGAGLAKAIQAISQTIAGISEIPANEKRYVLSTLNEINIKLSASVSSSQQVLDDLKVDMAKRIAPDPRLPSRYARITPTGSPKPPKRKKETPSKTGKAAVELLKKGATGVARFAKKVVNFATSRSWKFWLQLPLIIISLITTLAILFRYGKVGTIVDNSLGMVEDVAETGKIITSGAKDVAKGTDTAIRTSGSLWSSIGDGISNQYNKITSYWSSYFDDVEETETPTPVAQPSPTPATPATPVSQNPIERMKGLFD